MLMSQKFETFQSILKLFSLFCYAYVNLIQFPNFSICSGTLMLISLKFETFESTTVMVISLNFCRLMLISINFQTFSLPCYTKIVLTQFSNFSIYFAMLMLITLNLQTFQSILLH